MAQTKYGMISDVHEFPMLLPAAMAAFKNAGVNKLILNGDIGMYNAPLQNAQHSLAYILEQIGQSGLESYIQPGSHEYLDAYYPVLDAYTKKYPNIVDVLSNLKVESDDHHLVFLPGSDSNAGGEFTFGSGDLSTGQYFKDAEGKLVPAADKAAIEKLYNSNQLTGQMIYFNMNDLKNLVTMPDKTIAICHVPRRFDNLANAVDVAYFANNADTAIRPGILVEDSFKDYYYGDISKDLIEEFSKADGWALQTANRGNEDLKNLYNELGITKAVSGHFHESSHRAHDSNGIPVAQNTFVDNLFWNSGHMDKGYTGILTVKDGKVSYQNIVLK